MDNIQIHLDERSVMAMRGIVDQINRALKGQKMVPVEVRTPERETLPSYRLEMAKRIHGTRSRLGRTVEDVAESVGIPVRELEELEAGTYFPKNGDILFRLAEELGVHAFDFDPRFDPGGPLTSTPVHSSPYIQEVGPRVLYPERLADDGKDTDGSG